MANVLVADDDFISLEIMKAMLQRDGLQVTTVMNGQAAIDACAAGAFDLILLDYEMPDMTGAQVANRLREQSCRAPIIAVTGHNSAAELEACAAAGMVATLHKPLAPDALEALLQRWLP